MSSEIKSCYVYSDDPSLSAVYLPDETPVIIGRSVETKITDSKCSRKQVRLYASYANQKVFVQQIGPRSCGLNGFKTEKGVKIQARHGDRLEVLYGRYPYRIEFNPAPIEISSEGTAGRKRLCSDSEKEEEQTVSRRSKKKARTSREADPNTSACVDARDGSDSDQGDTDDFVDKATARAIMSKVNDRSEAIDKNVEWPDRTEPVDSPDKTTEDSWEELKTLMIYTSVGVQSRPKIAAYDMDNTLIKTISGYVFAKDHNDWQILYPEVPGKLKKLHADGYKIVIFTNQGGMFLGKIKPSDFKLKIERIVKKLGVPIQVFIAAGKDLYRKPRTGMWDTLVEDKNKGATVDKSKSFFVGDAAGRAKDWAPKKKKDHSSADRLFGLNLNLTFFTPEEHFLGQKPAPYSLPEFNPKKSTRVSLCEPSNADLTSGKQEVIIMVGGPGSGKSHVATTYLKDYHHVNRDKLGSWQKCVASMENALSEGKSVVIDNTNPDVESRKRFIEVAKAQSVPVRCFVMTTPKEHARHNNKFRELTDPSHTTVTDVIINSYSKMYVAPKHDEGFAEVVRINFVPRFDNDEHRKLYEMYLLEK